MKRGGFLNKVEGVEVLGNDFIKIGLLMWS